MDERPYPAYVPQSVKIYPVHQLLPTLPPPSADDWDFAMLPETAAYVRSFGQREVGRQVYLHIPFCPAFCHFCCLYKTMAPGEQSDDFIERFVQSLICEIGFYGRLDSAHRRPVTSIYFGGGTPTMLSPGQVERIMTALGKHLPIVSDPEVTFEGMAHHLRKVDLLRDMCANGVNRVSFGVQTFQPALRQQLGRIDTVEDVVAANDAIRSVPAIRDLNFELLIGIPHQDVAAVIADVEATVRARPDSTDVLFYNAVPGTKYYDMIRRGLRGPQAAGDLLLSMRREAIDCLQSNGYHHVTGEIFDRRPGKLDNFNDTHYGGISGLDEMLALGPSAYGFVDGTVYQNVPSVGRYMQCIDRRQLPLRTFLRIKRPQARRRGMLFGLQRGFIRREVVSSWYRPLVDSWRARRLVAAKATGWSLTPAGKLWYNMMQLEALPLWEAAQCMELTLDRHEQRRLLFRPQETVGNTLLARELEHLIEGRFRALRPLRRALFRTLVARPSAHGRLTFTGPEVDA